MYKNYGKNYEKNKKKAKTKESPKTATHQSEKMGESSTMESPKPPRKKNSCKPDSTIKAVKKSPKRTAFDLNQIEVHNNDPVYEIHMQQTSIKVICQK